MWPAIQGRVGTLLTLEYQRKLGSKLHAMHQLHPWSSSISWCLAEGLRNRDKLDPVSHPSLWRIYLYIFTMLVSHVSYFLHNLWQCLSFFKPLSSLVVLGTATGTWSVLKYSFPVLVLVLVRKYMYLLPRRTFSDKLQLLLCVSCNLVLRINSVHCLINYNCCFVCRVT